MAIQSVGRGISGISKGYGNVSSFSSFVSEMFFLTLTVETNSLSVAIDFTNIVMTIFNLVSLNALVNRAKCFLELR